MVFGQKTGNRFRVLPFLSGKFFKTKMRKTILFEGKRLVFHASGNDKLPIVLLHGFCEDHSVWDEMLPFLPKMRLIRIDLAGFGGSDLPARAGLGWQAEAVKAVLDFLKIERAVVVGHSMGGYVGLAFAKKFGDRLAGLGLVHSHPFEDSAERKTLRRKGIDFIHEKGLAPYCRQLFPGLFAPEFLEKNAPLLQKLTTRAAKMNPDGITMAIESMISRPGFEPALTAAAWPVLFVIGEKDGLLPTDQLLAQTALPPVADIHFLEDVGHMGMFEATERLAQILLDFHAFCTKTNQNR